MAKPSTIVPHPRDSASSPDQRYGLWFSGAYRDFCRSLEAEPDPADACMDEGRAEGLRGLDGAWIDCCNAPRGLFGPDATVDKDGGGPRVLALVGVLSVSGVVPGATSVGICSLGVSG